MENTTRRNGMLSITNKINTIQTNVRDCFIITPQLFKDERGIFAEIYKNSNNMFSCAQVNYSFSKQGTLRGMHKAPYAKLITCLQGKVFDVCLDLREDSETYGKYFALNLYPDSMKQLYIPANCAHGFYSYTDSTVMYLQDGEYRKEADEGFCYKNYGIDWPEEPSIISNRDSSCC